MARFPKPPEGSWTAHYPELGTAPVSYDDSISPEFYELERDAIFKRSWLNVGRVEQLSRRGSYFTKELAVARTSVVVVRGEMWKPFTVVDRNLFTGQNPASAGPLAQELLKVLPG